ncbi:hypothetical protein ACPSLZ_23475 [Vibrio campbellii]|uniref:hypothetical protein n=1 Tax=Vibrio campbellii TaxID=680 RepID=UPI003CE57684
MKVLLSCHLPKAVVGRHWATVAAIAGSSSRTERCVQGSVVRAYNLSTNNILTVKLTSVL